MRHLIIVSVLLLFIIPCDAQESGEYTLFVGEFENKTGIVNPLLALLGDTLNHVFSRSEQVRINTISSGLRSAYLQSALNEQPGADATQIAVRAAEYANADVVLIGSYSKTDAQWTMAAQLYVMRQGSRAREDIRLSGDSLYRLLDNLAAEVTKRLGVGQYVLLSTQSWEAYEEYRQGHKAYYSFNPMGAVGHFQKAIELDPRLAIAHAELSMSYLMLNDLDKTEKALAEAMKNLRKANKQEQLVVMGLASYYEMDIAVEIPRIRQDMVWDEAWLHWNIARSSKEESVRERGYKQWLTSARAYAKAGFYGASVLAGAGAAETTRLMTSSGIGEGTFVEAFNNTGNSDFLEAALQFVKQAADMEGDDEYNDAWKHWQLAKLYGMMNRTSDSYLQKEKWLQVVKSRAPGGLSSDAINDIARKCLDIGLLEDALDFSSKAIESESDPSLRSILLVTMGDIHAASGTANEAFDAYVEAFDILVRGDAGTEALSAGLPGLARLIRDNPEFVDEASQAKLNEMVETIGNMNPLLFRGSSAAKTMMARAVLKSTERFCIEMGNMEPIEKIVRGMMEAETDPSEKLVFQSYLFSFEPFADDFERPDSADVGKGWVVEEEDDGLSVNIVDGEALISGTQDTDWQRNGIFHRVNHTFSSLSFDFLISSFNAHMLVDDTVAGGRIDVMCGPDGLFLFSNSVDSIYREWTEIAGSQNVPGDWNTLGIEKVSDDGYQILHNGVPIGPILKNAGIKRIDRILLSAGSEAGTVGGMRIDNVVIKGGEKDAK